MYDACGKDETEEEERREMEGCRLF